MAKVGGGRGTQTYRQANNNNNNNRNKRSDWTSPNWGRVASHRFVRKAWEREFVAARNWKVKYDDGVRTQLYRWGGGSTRGFRGRSDYRWLSGANVGRTAFIVPGGGTHLTVNIGRVDAAITTRRKIPYTLWSSVNNNRCIIILL